MNNESFAFQTNNDESITDMLKDLNLKSINDLFKDIPSDLQIKEKPSSSFPTHHSEMEALRKLKEILKKNISGSDFLSFIGSGLYNHYIPAAVQEIQNRAEFRTSYTPYAPEMSQGLLKALFEYQSMITELTGLYAANTSIYDWATACAEAALMCARVTRKKEPIFLVASTISKERYETILTYNDPVNIKTHRVDFNRSSGQLDLKDLKSKLNLNVIGVYIESPNLFGVIEDQLAEIIKVTHKYDALAVVGVDMISLGILEAPGALGADICVGEGQPLGNAQNFGGPLLGVFTTSKDRMMLRNLPGRVIGLTKTQNKEKKAYVMTLQTREQHIRREKATSNICSNEALFSVAATVYLSLLGPQGLKDLCFHLIGRLGYIFDHFETDLTSKIKIPFKNSPHFKEFLITLPKGEYEPFKSYLLKKEILIGQNIGEYINLGSDAVILSLTEKYNISEIKRLMLAIQSYGDMI